MRTGWLGDVWWVFALRPAVADGAEGRTATVKQGLEGSL
jgi:hypothetical protein